MKKLCKEKDLEAVAQNVLVASSKKRTKGALVLALFGNLGAGKTTFTQALARVLKAQKAVKSPTFILMRKSPIVWRDKKTLVHIDAYRFENEKDATPLHLAEVFSDPQNIVVIEWADRIKKLLPHNTYELHFEFIDAKTRSIQW